MIYTEQINEIWRQNEMWIVKEMKSATRSVILSKEMSERDREKKKDEQIRKNEAEREMEKKLDSIYTDDGGHLC